MSESALAETEIETHMAHARCMGACKMTEDEMSGNLFPSGHIMCRAPHRKRSPPTGRALQREHARRDLAYLVHLV